MSSQAKAVAGGILMLAGLVGLTVFVAMDGNKNLSNIGAGIFGAAYLVGLLTALLSIR